MSTTFANDDDTADLSMADTIKAALVLHFQDHGSLTLGAGYVKSGDEIEIVEVALMFRDSSKDERLKIARFLRGVFEASTHGASSLMARAIKAVEDGDMSDPIRVAQPTIL